MATRERSFINEHIGDASLYEEAREAVRQEFLHNLWDVGGLNVGGRNVTVLDTFRIPGDPVEAICNRLGVSAEKLRDNGNPETIRLFKNLNQALADAHSYLVKYLDLQLPASLRNPASVHTLDDLVKLVEKCALYGPESKKHLSEHAAYCDYLSAGLATYELQKGEARALDKEIRYVEDAFTREQGGKEAFLIPASAGDTAGAGRKYYLRDLPDCSVTVTFRDKTQFSQITKFLAKPEASAKEALKDALGMRIEAPADQLVNVMDILLPFLKEQFSGTEMLVENINMLSAAQMAELEDAVKTGGASDVADIVPPKPNAKSHVNYQTLKVVLTIQMPENGMPGRLAHERMEEIQLVPEGHKNESGTRNWNVYELKKKIDVMTRLKGGCSAAWLEKQARRIPEVGGPNWEKIRNSLIEEGSMFELPGRRGDRFGSVDVYRRWISIHQRLKDENKGGFLPDEFASLIERALPKEK